MTFTRNFLGQVYGGCNGHCFYCGKEVDPFEHWEPDHLVPRSQGGGDGLANLVLACRRCNRSKGARGVDDYRYALTRRIEVLAEKAHNLFNELPRFLTNQELQGLESSLINAQGYASVAIVIFYGEATPLPRDTYAPLRLKSLDVSALDDESFELTATEYHYLLLKKHGTVASRPEESASAQESEQGE